MGNEPDGPVATAHQARLWAPERARAKEAKPASGGTPPLAPAGKAR